MQPFQRVETVNHATGQPQSDPYSDEVWANDRYVVHVRRLEPNKEGAPTMVHLSIHDNERSARHDWREFQAIKNELVGPDCWGFELYPAEEHLVDTSNQYHLWVVAEPHVSLPVGFFDGRIVMTPDQLAQVQPGATQRPFDYDEPGTDPNSPELQAMLAKVRRET